jgi:hypothetical protein
MNTSQMPRHLAALQDFGSPDAAPGSPPWARFVRAQLEDLLSDETANVYRVRDYIKGLEEHKGYAVLERKDGAPFASLHEFVTTRRPFGLGFDPLLHLLVMAETTDRIGINTLAELRARQDQAMAAMVEPSNGHGGDRKTDRSKLLSNVEKRGNAKLSRLRKLKRDHPHLAERLASGDLKTLREAEKAAGVPRQKRLPKDPHTLIAMARQEHGEAYITALREALKEA